MRPDTATEVDVYTSNLEHKVQGPSTLNLHVALVQLWSAIRRHHREVPEAVLLIAQGSGRQPSSLALGHWATSRWVDQTGREHPEVMIAGEGLLLGAEEVLNTVLHEAAHGLAFARGLEDTSRGHRYHNATFRHLAMELLLSVDRSETSGFSRTALTDAARRRYLNHLGELETAITVHRRHEAEFSGASSTGSSPRRSRIPLACSCHTPRKFYIAPGIAELGTITCDLCHETFQSPTSGAGESRS